MCRTLFHHCDLQAQLLHKSHSAPASVCRFANSVVSLRLSRHAAHPGKNLWHAFCSEEDEPAAAPGCAISPLLEN